MTKKQVTQLFEEQKVRTIKKEGNEAVTNCNPLKMRAADGKMRLTDVADTEQPASS